MDSIELLVSELEKEVGSAVKELEIAAIQLNEANRIISFLRKENESLRALLSKGRLSRANVFDGGGMRVPVNLDDNGPETPA